MDKQNLKNLIKTEAAEARQLRNLSRQALTEARALDKQARKSPDPAIVEQSQALYHKGFNLYDQAKSGRNERRHQCLAAAFLNGRTYKQCEAKLVDAPGLSVRQIAELLDLAVFDNHRDLAYACIKAWVVDGGTLKDILPACRPLYPNSAPTGFVSKVVNLVKRVAA